jgi:hypothetical protein
MLLDPIFERFVADRPLSVMTRGTIEHALSADALNVFFKYTADKQYTRELLFSTVVLGRPQFCGHFDREAVSP